MKTIDEVIAEMYAQVSFERGERHGLDRQREIFAPNARVVRVTDDGVFEFTLDEYRRDFERMKMVSFWEGELWRQTFLVGDVATVLSAYETRRERAGEMITRGVNSIQMFQRGGDWWISAMIWRREGKSVRP